MATDPVAEIGLEEAERAEREAFEREQAEEAARFDGEPEPEPTPEPEPEPEPDPGPPSDVLAEQAMAAIDKAGDAYVKKVSKISDTAELGLTQCPVCPVPGFVPDVPGLGLPPDQRDLVLAILGAEPAPELPQHPDLIQCATCEGFGLLPTGSHREAFQERPCPDCGGDGYRDKRQMQALEDARPPDALGHLAVVPPPAPAAAVAPLPGQVTQGGHVFFPVPGGAGDPYGRIAGHPLWGQDPSMGGL